MEKALITGITGQDGSYLAEFLLVKGYEVHGLKRRTSLFNTDRIDHLYAGPEIRSRRFILHHGDMTDSSSLIRIIQQVQPDDETLLLTENESTYIPVEKRHRLESPGKVMLEMIEVQSGSYLSEDDIARLDDSYRRCR